MIFKKWILVPGFSLLSWLAPIATPVSLAASPLAKAHEKILIAQQSSTDELSELITSCQHQYEVGSTDSLRQAAQFCRQAVPRLRQAGDQNAIATILSLLGSIHKELQEPPIALEYAQQALTISQAIGAQTTEAITLTLIAMLYDDLKQKEAALSYYQQALALPQAIEATGIEAAISNNMAANYQSLGEKEKALSFYQRALALCQTAGDTNGEMAALNNIGWAYYALGRSDLALTYYQQVLPAMRASNNPLQTAKTLSNLGLAHSALGEVETALDYFQQALPLSQASGDQAVEAVVLNNIGFIYDGQGKKEEALGRYQEALALAQVLGDRNNEAAVLHNIGAVYEGLQQSTKALEYYQQALPLTQLTGNREGEASTLNHLAAVYQQQNNLSDALSTINQAISLVEDLRTDIAPGDLRTSYFSTVQSYYRRKLKILMQLGQPEAAFETSEASRARVLVEMLSEANVDIRQGVNPTLLAREQSLRNEIRQIETRRIDLRSREHTETEADTLDRQSDAQLQQLDQVLSQIRRSSPAYAETIQPQPLSLEQIQQQTLDTDTVLVQYALGIEKSYLWLVGKDNFEVYELPNQDNIQITAERFKSAISYRSSLSDIKTAGDELTAQILPERPDWIDGKRLLIVGDGILTELPFAALPLPNKVDYTPLLTEHEVLSQPSITAISVLRKQLGDRTSRPPSFAVLADPVYRADDERLQQSSPITTLPTATERNLRDLDLRTIERLPYTRQEAENILNLATSNNLETISALDFNATTNWVSSPEAQQKSILHLATHGFINPANPQLSGIVLSLVDSNGQLNEDGFLRLYDIFNLTLTAELVVLSACQTGQGQNISGEGIIGLSRGFMYAGAERIAVSLWNVQDEATASLMSEFYRHLIEDNLTPAGALRAAQIEAWEAGQNPYLWAAFTLQGEWQ